MGVWGYEMGFQVSLIPDQIIYLSLLPPHTPHTPRSLGLVALAALQFKARR